MSKIKTRLLKLESILKPAPEPIHIMRIIVDVGGIVPVGYRCGKIEIIRQLDDSEEEFKTRCHDSVDWPPGNSKLIFSPIYKQGQQ